jgi:hypothetical protein
MAKAGDIIEFDWTWNDETYKLFSKAGDVEDFLDGLSEQTTVNRAPVQVAVGGHTRRRYPGGPGISVGGFTRTTLLGGDGNRATLPGQNAYFETEVSDGTELKVEVTTITFTGPYTSLYQYCLANAKLAFNLRSPDGTVDEITIAG